MDQICPKRVFPVKNKKVNTTIEFCIFKLTFVSSSTLNDNIDNFKQIWPKRVFPVENKKWRASLNSAYSNWTRNQILLWTYNFDFLDKNLPKRVFLVKNEKSEHHHWILQIRISLSIKFHLKLTILTFWTKFNWKQKRSTTLLNSAYSNRARCHISRCCRTSRPIKRVDYLWQHYENAMAPLGQVRVSWLSIKMKTKMKIQFYFHFRFCFHFIFHYRFCFHFHFCFYFRFCFCFHFCCFCFCCFSFAFLVFIFKFLNYFYYGTSRPS